MDKLNDWIVEPRWMSVSLIVLKWMMVLMPFIISSIVFFVYELSTTENWMLTWIYIMSLMKIIDMADRK